MKHLAEKVIKLARVGLLMALAGIFVPSLSFALGTIAGTGIDNTAVVSYEVAGTLEAGLHADLYQADKHNIFVEFGVLATTNGTIKIDLSNSGYGEPTLDLGDGTGLAVRAGWSRLLNKNNSWSILFDYTRWDFNRSNSQSLSDGINSIIITEPESLSKQASLHFIYQHHF